MDLSRPALLAILLLPLAGCIAPEGQDGLEVHAFRASVEHDGAIKQLQLDGPHRVPHPDVGWLDAYRLQISIAGSLGRSYYLDGDFRVVAVEINCAGSLELCDTHVRWSWAEQGMLAPFGVGWNLQKSEKLALTNHGGEADVQKNGSVRVSPEHASAYTPGIYTYDKGRLVPTRGPGFHQIAYTRGDLLSDVTPHVLEQIPPRSEPEGKWFAGDNDDPGGEGYSLADIIDRAASGHQCVRTLSVLYTNSTPQPLDVTVARRLVLQADVILQRNMHAEVFDIRLWRDRLGNDEWDVEPSGHAVPSFGCSDLDKSPGPVLTLTQARRFAEDLPLSHNGTSIHAYNAGTRLQGLGYQPQSGWEELQIFLAPAEGIVNPSGLQYHVSFHGGTGQIHDILAHPKDAARGFGFSS